MKQKDTILFRVLHVIAWIIFVGLSIEAGGLLVNFVVSLINPDLVSRLYMKLDLSALYENSRPLFIQVYSLMLSIIVLKVILFYALVILMHKIDLSKPFSPYVSRQILNISYWTFSIGLMSAIAREFVRRLYRTEVPVDYLDQFWSDGKAFLLMGAVIYIIALIFRRGVELQEESELTV